MTEQHSAPDTAELERLVQQVRGVQAVRIVVDSQGQIDELHVVGTPDRSAKAIVRDIESILYVRGRVRLNHRKISLVQVPESATLAFGSRVQLVSVARAVAGSGPAVSVVLAVGDQRYSGAASDGAVDEPDEQLVGRATIDALGQITAERGRFQIERVQRQPLGELDVCLAHVSLTVEDALETLLGVSIVRGDPLVSAARAVLDAVNRRLPSLVGSRGRAGL
jgi:hypothetical protein